MTVDRKIVHIKSRLEYDPWTCPESYSPEPVAPSFRDVLSGISDALGEWIATPQFQSGMMFAVALMIGVWLACGRS